MTNLVWDDVQYLGDIPPMLELAQIQYYENHIYLAAGKATSSANQFPSEFFRYSFSDNHWKDLTNWGSSYTSRSFSGSGIVDGFFYLLYGFSDDTSAQVNEINRVNLSSSSDFAWEKVSLQNSGLRDSFATAMYDSQIYMFGGSVTESERSVNELILFDPFSANFTTISADNLFPPPRMGCSLSLLNANLYLFGGQGVSTAYDDLWIYSIQSGAWLQPVQFGTTPSPRSGHASSSQGDALAIWGGQGDSGLLDDLFLYNALTSSWTGLTAVSKSMPQAAVGACLVMALPKIYIFGGVSALGCLGELWLYNTAHNTYTLIDSGGPQLAYIYCSLSGNLLYVAFGQDIAAEASPSIQAFNLTSLTWSDLDYPAPDVATAQGIQMKMGDSFIKIAGEAWGINPNNQVYVMTSTGAVLVGVIQEYVYLAGSAYYNTSLYTFGGGTIVGKALRSSVPSNVFIRIDLLDVCSNGYCTPLCSPGTYQYQSSCLASNPGFYVQGFGSTAETPCPAGTIGLNQGATTSRECYPCPTGSFNPYKGSSYCFNCPSQFSCPIGSIAPISTYYESTYKSIQPDLYKAPDISEITLEYELVVGLFMLGIIIICVCWKRIGNKLSVMDFYPAMHNHFKLEVMILDNTFLGGLFSLFFITGAMILIGISIIAYDLNNIKETKALVPLVVLESEVSAFVASDVHIYVSFLGYRDSCGGAGASCGSLISISFLGTESSSTSSSCTLVSDTCLVTAACMDCILDVGSGLSIVLQEPLSYAVGIQVNVSSSSSIPGTRSSVLTDVYPKAGYMFIGSLPSTFYFVMIPSLFESETSQWPPKETGYHVSAGAGTQAGSEYLSADLPTTSQLQANINLDTSNSSLYTSRVLVQSFIFLLSSLLGSVFGIMGAVGAAMKFLEGQILKRKNIEKKNRDIRETKRRGKMIRDNITDEEMFKDPRRNSKHIRKFLGARHSHSSISAPEVRV